MYLILWNFICGWQAECNIALIFCQIKERVVVESESPRALYISGLPNSFDANGKYHMKHSPVHSSFPHYVCSATASISISFDQYQSQWIIKDKKGDVLIAYAKEKVPHPAEVAGLWRVLDPISNSYVQSGLLQVTHAASVNNPNFLFLHNLHSKYCMNEKDLINKGFLEYAA